MNSTIYTGRLMSRIVLSSLALAIAAAWAVHAQSAVKAEIFPGSFEAIKAPDCISPSFYYSPFSTGKQYRDPTYNGVRYNQWFMLLRWQDWPQTAYINYNMGPFTGLHGVSSPGQWGYYPESSSGTPGAQVNCYDASMLLNSWTTPHRPIVGGGYNDMYGYAWQSGARPKPFVKNGVRTHLVLQGSLGVNIYWPTAPNPAAPTDFNVRTVDRTLASAQLGFFAYVRDTRPGYEYLPPIAIIAGAYDSQWEPALHDPGVIGIDYNASMTQQFKSQLPNWFQNDNSSEGVWFASASISRASTNTQLLVDTYYTQMPDGQSNGTMMPVWGNGYPARPFFRAHISAENMEEIARRIDTACDFQNRLPNGKECLARGYSQNATDYELEYAGVIGETAILNELSVTDTYDYAPWQWTLNDHYKRQVSLGASIYGIGIYRGIPN